jgi:hypothetical protein
MGIPETTAGIPLPPPGAHSPATAGAGQVRQLVAAFLSATGALSCEAAAELAGVRTETIRKWRPRPPTWLRAATSRRMSACVAGKPAPDPDASFDRSFRRVLRSVPGAEHRPGVPSDTSIPP